MANGSILGKYLALLCRTFTASYDQKFQRCEWASWKEQIVEFLSIFVDLQWMKNNMSMLENYLASVFSLQVMTTDIPEV